MGGAALIRLDLQCLLSCCCCWLIGIDAAYRSYAANLARDASGVSCGSHVAHAASVGAASSSVVTNVKWRALASNAIGS